MSLSKIYIVLAFFASLGGMITLIGGGGHLVVQGFLEESAYEGFTFFEFVRIGLPIALISFIWLMFLASRISLSVKLMRAIFRILQSVNLLKWYSLH